MDAIESEEVLVANTQSFLTIFSNSANTCFLICKSSTMASIIKSQASKDLKLD